MPGLALYICMTGAATDDQSDQSADDERVQSDHSADDDWTTNASADDDWTTIATVYPSCASVSAGSYDAADDR